jgi:wyosine [tRNA(Phe)-imidazoG37] synthetase (radical SAM superfamily)
LDYFSGCRSFFHELQDIANSVRRKIKQTRDKCESIDYLTFVPDGEPTLDVNLGTEIEFLKSFGMKIAVVTNASLI